MSAFRCAVLLVSLSGAQMAARSFAIAGELAPQAQGRIAVAGLEEAQVRSFLEKLQAAVRSRDAAAVAELASYPLAVNTKGHRESVRSKAHLVRRFSSIFDSLVTQEILSQRLEDLFSNSNGVMIGSGSVWFSGVCDHDSPPGTCRGMRVLVVAINRSDR